MIDHNWLAAYLYVDDHWEDLLRQVVQPLVKDVMAAGLADGYFFIRYWEKGPHLRLRFHGDPQQMKQSIQPLLEERVQTWFSAHPSSRDQQTQEMALKNDWYPQHSIQYIDYEPEVQRYGGAAGMPIAERQFQASSDAVLAVLNESEGEWSYERALGIALQMHLAFVQAMGIEDQDVKPFFQGVSRGWFPRSYGYYPEMSQEEQKERATEAQAAFETAFQAQRQVIVPFSQTLWQAFHDKVSFEQEWLNRWIVEMGQIKQSLLEQADRIDFYESTFGRKSEVDWQRCRSWSILESYIHMTNNRLGILNRDEAFLGYMLKETFDLL